MKRSVLLGLLLTFLLAGSGLAILRRPSLFTRDVHDYTYFFRMRVHLRHKDNPLDAELVVGCGVRVTAYKDGGRSVDVGIYPYHYAFEIPGGHAIEVRPPTACRGQTTANGKIPKSFLPYVIWYERAEDLSFGILYASDDAYRNSRSQLAFEGAEIEPASRADFDRWRASAPENLIQPYNAGSLRGAFWPGYRLTEDLIFNPALYARQWGPPLWCYAAIRLRLPEEVREAVRRHWPAGRPRYWLVDYPERNEMNKILRGDGKTPNPRFEGHTFDRYGTLVGDYGRGLIMRSGGSRVGGNPYEFQGPLFPLRSETAVAFLTRDLGRSGTIYADLEIGPQMQGFAYCSDDVEPRHAQLARMLLKEPGHDPLRERLKFRVNGEDVSGEARYFEQFLIFENDEFALESRIF